MCDTTSSAYSPDPIESLKEAVREIRFAVDRIREWPRPPDPSLVAAWAPLLMERLRQIENPLLRCIDRLEPPASKIGNEQSDAIRPGMTMAEAEKIHIIQTLKVAGGNRERAAGLLDIGARTLFRKLTEYEIDQGADREVSSTAGVDTKTPAGEPIDLIREADSVRDRSVGPRTFADFVEAAERRAIEWALREHHGNKSRAARILEISRSTLHTKMCEYGIII